MASIDVDTDTQGTPLLLESRWNVKESNKETAAIKRHGRTAHNASSSSLRKKRSDLKLVPKAPYKWLRQVLANLQEVLLGTKLFLLFPAVPLAVFAHIYRFSAGWVFALSLLGLTPLAERISFLTEQITFYTGATVGGLLNATCGNATELIIAVLAVKERKMQVVKLSLLGSVLSDLLLVLGTSLFSGGIVNLNQEQYFDRKQSDVNCLLLFLSLLCHTLPMMFRYVEGSDVAPAQGEKVDSSLQLSRACSLAMLFAYLAFLIFQLWSHRQFFEAPQEDDVYNDDVNANEEPAIGFWSSLVWLVGMSLVVALLSEYVVGTIEDAADSWGLSVSFVCIILLPIVSNAAEHAGAVIFAVRNKLDISLGVALGSGTQIAVFVVPVTVIVAWAMGIEMDLSFNILETTGLALSIIIVSFALQDGSSHYMKGLVLVLSYVVIAACFFVSRSPPTQTVNADTNMRFESMTAPIFTY